MGINMLKKLLTKNKVSYSEIHGSLSKKQRDNEVKLYNTNVNKIMIVTAAGSEGLDLKETRTVILLEPYWNPSRTEQVIGRAARFMSHSTLPLQDRRVDVYHLILQKPWVLPSLYGDHSYSVDEGMTLLASNKLKNITKFYDLLSKISIERDFNCFK
jgi:superfamily II DNA/RNA helicase